MSSSLTVARIDSIVDSLEIGIEKLDACEGNRVKLPKAKLEVLQHMDKAREFMMAVLKSNRNHHALLHDIFRDCKRISRIRAALESLGGVMLENNGADGRLGSCLDACKSVERVLCDGGFDVELEKAQAEQRRALKTRRSSSIGSCLEAYEYCARADAMHQHSGFAEAIDASIELDDLPAHCENQTVEIEPKLPPLPEACLAAHGTSTPRASARMAKVDEFAHTSHAPSGKGAAVSADIRAPEVTPSENGSDHENERAQLHRRLENVEQSVTSLQEELRTTREDSAIKITELKSNLWDCERRAQEDVVQLRARIHDLESWIQELSQNIQPRSEQVERIVAEEPKTGKGLLSSKSPTRPRGSCVGCLSPSITQITRRYLAGDVGLTLFWNGFAAFWTWAVLIRGSPSFALASLPFWACGADLCYRSLAVSS